MPRKFWELLFIFGLTSIGGSLVLGASIGTDDLPPETVDRLREIKQNIFFSDELTSSEYRDDLDVELSPRENVEDHEWDLVVFTQQWPVTTCYHWREEDKNHKCKLPSAKEFWTIHGVWPTKFGQFGPSFCNKSADFDINQLEEIKDDLNEYWPDIDGKSNDFWFWKHEWLKHGTCAASLEQLNNEFKYFNQGINWRENFLLANILGSAGIHPDSNNTVVALNAALVNGLGKNPSIHCLYDSKNDVSYLEEIRICFNKTLDLTDCDGVKLGDAVSVSYPGGTVNTNCHISKPVHYPSLVPNRQRANEKKWKFPIVNIYKLLQFIMWFTL
ncbi:ribonuclease X25 [Cochliomyia hominivorax]